MPVIGSAEVPAVVRIGEQTGSSTGGIYGSSNPASATLTLPASGTAQYAIGDLIANSGTAGSVTPMQFTVARAVDKTFSIRRLRLKKTGTSLTGAAFRLHLFRNSPVVTVGDNGVFASGNVLACNESNYLGYIDVTMDRQFSDAAKGFGIPNVGTEITGDPFTGTQLIYGLLEARGTYTPANSEMFTAVLEAFQD